MINSAINLSMFMLSLSFVIVCLLPFEWSRICACCLSFVYIKNWTNSENSSISQLRFLFVIYLRFIITLVKGMFDLQIDKKKKVCNCLLVHYILQKPVQDMAYARCLIFWLYILFLNSSFTCISGRDEYWKLVAKKYY
jgi:hypothetical protein